VFVKEDKKIYILKGTGTYDSNENEILRFEEFKAGSDIK
jgi:hypothetical protein